MDHQATEELISSANEHEADSNHLLNHLKSQLGDLPRVITLPPNNPSEALREFVKDYIESVPRFIFAVSIAAKEAGIEPYVEPFLGVATEYFLSSLNRKEDRKGLVELMDRAYLSHRLIEEVNDQYIVRAGIPLIPLDVTKANIIVHHLIGETLANSLDEVVEETARQMTNQDSVYGSEKFQEYVETRKGKGWDEVWKLWADMTSSLHIDLNFELAADKVDKKAH